MPQSQAWFEVHAAFIRAAMKLGLIHPLQQRAIHLALRIRIKYTGNAAHLLTLF